MKKAKVYISHFIQVLNMSVMRGDCPPDTRKFFGLEDYGSRIPPLNSEHDIIEWGEKLIKGEAKRVLAGNSPVTNPTIALVRVRYENFLETHHYQKTLQKNTARALEKLTELRTKADNIILQIWNEVEESFSDLPDDLKRDKTQEYGVVYVYRKNEISSLRFCGSRQRGTG